MGQNQITLTFLKSFGHSTIENTNIQQLGSPAVTLHCIGYFENLF